ncbi:protein RRNAD1-like [Drosophila persimilis]|uniref:protein RRNAD1-like n=1 Tax=Drosophila persimilis TaxID=7234 RepID=UPI000F07FBDF|nr:protein RRNAD1-like [Drosophila persimilis]
MPLDMKNYFLAVSNEKLNEFPFIYENLDSFPTSLLSFRKNLASLTPKETFDHSFFEVTGRQTTSKRRISTKKQHEIKHFATHIHTQCLNEKILVDLGSGLGYLSQALYELDPNRSILGLEADETRVEAARSRCRQWLPSAATKSISYQQKYVDADSGAYIDTHSLALAKNNGFLEVKSMSIIGLHACADLSINAMRLFLKMDRVRSLHIMPCCYHKLALQSAGGGVNSPDQPNFVNFPLSIALRKAVEACKTELYLNRPFLRLACQQTRARWRRTSYEEHAEHGDQMYTRALADSVRHSNELVKPKKCILPSHENQDAFWEIVRKFQLFSKETGAPLEWQPTHKTRFIAISDKYTDKQGPRLAEALQCLQTAMQKLCENVILFDRLCYLQEAAAEHKVNVRVRYEKLLDEEVSPRCHVLVAEKLS